MEVAVPKFFGESGDTFSDPEGGVGPCDLGTCETVESNRFGMERERQHVR